VTHKPGGFCQQATAADGRAILCNSMQLVTYFDLLPLPRDMCEGCRASWIACSAYVCHFADVLV
jgi:hypothetical protein